jgi:hypothetical protein
MLNSSPLVLRSRTRRSSSISCHFPRQSWNWGRVDANGVLCWFADVEHQTTKPQSGDLSLATSSLSLDLQIQAMGELGNVQRKGHRYIPRSYTESSAAEK